MRFAQLLGRVGTFLPSLPRSHPWAVPHEQNKRRLSESGYLPVSSQALFHPKKYIYIYIYVCCFFFKCSSLQKVAENENVTEKEAAWVGGGGATDRDVLMQADIVETSKQRESTSALSLVLLGELKWRRRNDFPLWKSGEEPSSMGSHPASVCCVQSSVPSSQYCPNYSILVKFSRLKTIVQDRSCDANKVFTYWA